MLRLSFTHVQKQLVELFQDSRPQSLLAHKISMLTQEVFDLKLVMLDRIQQAKKESKEQEKSKNYIVSTVIKALQAPVQQMKKTQQSVELVKAQLEQTSLLKDHDKELFRQQLCKDNSKYDLSRVKEFLDMFLPLPATTGAIE